MSTDEEALANCSIPLGSEIYLPNSAYAHWQEQTPMSLEEILNAAGFNGPKINDSTGVSSTNEEGKMEAGWSGSNDEEDSVDERLGQIMEECSAMIKDEFNRCLSTRKRPKRKGVKQRTKDAYGLPLKQNKLFAHVLKQWASKELVPLLNQVDGGKPCLDRQQAAEFLNALNRVTTVMGDFASSAKDQQLKESAPLEAFTNEEFARDLIVAGHGKLLEESNEVEKLKGQVGDIAKTDNVPQIVAAPVKRKRNPPSGRKVVMDKLISGEEWWGELTNEDFVTFRSPERGEAVQVRWLAAHDVNESTDVDDVVELTFSVEEFREIVRRVKAEFGYVEKSDGEENDVCCNRHLFPEDMSAEKAASICRNRRVHRFPPLHFGGGRLVLSEIVSRRVINVRMLFELLKVDKSKRFVLRVHGNGSVGCVCGELGTASRHVPVSYYFCRLEDKSDLFGCLFDDDETRRYFVLGNGAVVFGASVFNRWKKRDRVGGMRMIELPRIRRKYQQCGVMCGKFPWNPFSLKEQWVSLKLCCFELESSEELRAHVGGGEDFAALEKKCLDELCRRALAAAQYGQFCLDSQIGWSCRRCGFSPALTPSKSVTVRTRMRSDGNVNQSTSYALQASPKREVLCPNHGDPLQAHDLESLVEVSLERSLCPIQDAVSLARVYDGSSILYDVSLYFLSYDATVKEIKVLNEKQVRDLRCVCRFASERESEILPGGVIQFEVVKARQWYLVFESVGERGIKVVVPSFVSNPCMLQVAKAVKQMCRLEVKDRETVSERLVAVLEDCCEGMCDRVKKEGGLARRMLVGSFVQKVEMVFMEFQNMFDRRKLDLSPSQMLGRMSPDRRVSGESEERVSEDRLMLQLDELLEGMFNGV